MRAGLRGGLGGGLRQAIGTHSGQRSASAQTPLSVMLYSSLPSICRLVLSRFTSVSLAQPFDNAMMPASDRLGTLETSSDKRQGHALDMLRMPAVASGEGGEKGHHLTRPLPTRRP